MKKINKLFYTIIAFLAITCSIFASGGERNGTAGATELLIPVGARGIAMGGATLTNSYGLESVYWNPANLAVGNYNSEVFFSHMSYIADIGIEYGAVSTSIEGFGSIALTIKSLAFDEIPVTTNENPDGTGQTYTPNYMTIGFTYAKQLSDRISVGLTANYVSEEIDRVSATGFAFNVGIAYQNLGNIDGLDIAFVLKNVGPQMEFGGSALYVEATAQGQSRGTSFLEIDAAKFDLPSSLELGLGYSINMNEMNSIEFSGSFQNNNFLGDEYRIGAEYTYDNLFFVRGGYDYMADVTEDENIYGLTAGAGLNYNLGDASIQIDYAYRQADFFDDNHVFTVGLGF
ncbi:MAG: PorV/PorQ family protein [Ignavibacteria bacterium]|jgi:hypothetical protein